MAAAYSFPFLFRPLPTYLTLFCWCLLPKTVLIILLPYLVPSMTFYFLLNKSQVTLFSYYLESLHALAQVTFTVWFPMIRLPFCHVPANTDYYLFLTEPSFFDRWACGFSHVLVSRSDFYSSSLLNFAGSDLTQTWKPGSKTIFMKVHYNSMKYLPPWTPHFYFTLLMWVSILYGTTIHALFKDSS